jgi:hypothetical protein
MTDLLRWGNQLFPDNPSFRAAATSTRDISRGALDAVRGGVLSVARNALAFVLTRPLGAAVLITVLCASTFCAVGYVHYKHAASDERIADPASGGKPQPHATADTGPFETADRDFVHRWPLGVSSRSSTPIKPPLEPVLGGCSWLQGPLMAGANANL